MNDDDLFSSICLTRPLRSSQQTIWISMDESKLTPMSNFYFPSRPSVKNLNDISTTNPLFLYSSPGASKIVFIITTDRNNLTTDRFHYAVSMNFAFLETMSKWSNITLAYDCAIVHVRYFRQIHKFIREFVGRHWIDHRLDNAIMLCRSHVEYNELSKLFARKFCPKSRIELQSRFSGGSNYA